MAKYVVLFNWTDTGVQRVKETVDRVGDARSAFGSLGVTIESIYWTQGECDLVGICDAPDDQTLAAALLRLATRGGVRTRTLRAFDEQEVRQILQRIE